MHLSRPGFQFALSLTAIFLWGGIQANSRPGAINPLRQAMVSLNFDDGYESAYIKGYPLLESSGFVATYYVITSNLKNPAPGYMNLNEVNDLMRHGNEIGSHTRTHPHLETLSEASLAEEINGSLKDLREAGIHASTFAYPYGEYNLSIVSMVKHAGFIGARITEPALNDASANRFLLKRIGVISTTRFSEIRTAIDTCIETKSWLILLFHRIEKSQKLYSADPQTLEQIVAYLRLKKIHPVTNEQGLRLSGLYRP